MKILLNILKEIGIAIVIIVILAAVVFVAFKDKIPYGMEIPKGDKYVQADSKEYSAASNNRLENIKQITVTHETEPIQITNAENYVRIQTGKATPFGDISSNSDLPTEKVNGTINMTTGGEKKNNKSNEEDLVYPSTGDETVDGIRAAESEKPEDAAARRFQTAGE